MKRKIAIALLFGISFTCFFSCKNSSDDGGEEEKKVSYVINETIWDATMNGLPFITSADSNFTYKYYTIYSDDTALGQVIKKESLKLNLEMIISGTSYQSMVDYSDFESTGKSKEYDCYNKKYNYWLYRYFDKGLEETAYDFGLFYGLEELREVFVTKKATLYPAFSELTFENNVYSVTRENVGDYDCTYRYEFTFEDEKLAACKVYELWEDEDEETGEPVQVEDLVCYVTFSDWGTTSVTLPETHALEEMDFADLENFLYTVCYDLDRGNRYSFRWDSDENAAWVKLVYSGLIYYEYNDETEESEYKVKKEDRIREDIIRFFIKNGMGRYAEIDDLSSTIPEDSDCIYLGQFKSGNQYYIEIVEEQVFSQTEEKAPIFTVRVKKENS